MRVAQGATQASNVSEKEQKKKHTAVQRKDEKSFQETVCSTTTWICNVRVPGARARQPTPPLCDLAGHG